MKDRRAQEKDKAKKYTLNLCCSHQAYENIMKMHMFSIGFCVFFVFSSWASCGPYSPTQRVDKKSSLALSHFLCGTDTPHSSLKQFFTKKNASTLYVLLFRLAFVHFRLILLFFDSRGSFSSIRFSLLIWLLSRSASFLFALIRQATEIFMFSYSLFLYT